jgi:hypothetical protein
MTMMTRMKIRGVCFIVALYAVVFTGAATVTRTLWALRGKAPVTSHINTIMDYSFYWFLDIYDYYL